METVLSIALAWLKKNFLQVLPYLIIAGMLLGVWLLYKENRSLASKCALEGSNLSAYSMQLDSVRNQSGVFQLKVQQLEYFNDSLVSSLKSYQKELGIKDRNIRQLALIKSHVQTKDSIVSVHDTLFRDSLKFDTVFSDKWHTVKLSMKYPSKISIETSFRSKKYIAVEAKRVIDGTPKKFFLLRWFQKRKTVLRVTVKDRNPYVTEDGQTFVEVLK